eukprot:Skav226350  [mRNA]  locus=scaffold2980:276189:287601:- [translate_table: standard]
MSIRGDDSEVVELAVELAGVLITVRGHPRQAADFIQQVAQQPPELRQDSAPRDSPAAATPASSATSETRVSIAAAFPPCPQHWVVTASGALRSQAARLTGAERARRAWLAGQWARAVLEGRVATPNASETIDLGNRYWCVVRCPHCRVPRIFTTSGNYWSAVRRLEGTDTISHAFASETEAHIYLEAAGFEELNWTCTVDSKTGREESLAQVTDYMGMPVPSLKKQADGTLEVVKPREEIAPIFIWESSRNMIEHAPTLKFRGLVNRLSGVHHFTKVGMLELVRERCHLDAFIPER